MPRGASCRPSARGAPSGVRDLRGRALAGGLLATTLAVSACSDSSAPDQIPPEETGPGATASGPPPSADTGSTTTPAPAADGQATSAPAPAVVTWDAALPPGSPAGEQLTWVLETLNGENPPAAEVEARFSDTFLDQVPAEQLGPVLGQMRLLGPFTVTGVEDQGATVIATLDGAQPLVLTLMANDSGQIWGLTFTPPGPTADELPEVGSVEEALADIEASGQQTQVLVARVEDGRCVPEVEVDAEQPGPIGSIAKLPVLAVLVDTIESGDLAWDDVLTVDADAVSLPSGRLQEEADGTEVTVREAADLMISISDNTATDLLIEELGPERIEAALPGLGVEDPSGMTPFPTTVELFQLIWGPSPEATSAREAWPVADDEEQRALLETLPEGTGDLDLATLDPSPRWRDGFDWIATSADVCAFHVALQERAGTEAGAPVREILATNPGIGAAAVPDDLDYLGFKGGALVGALSLSWYAEPTSGPYAGDDLVVVARVQSDSPVDEQATVGAVGGLLGLVLTDEPAGASP